MKLVTVQIGSCHLHLSNGAHIAVTRTERGIDWVLSSDAVTHVADDLYPDDARMVLPSGKVVSTNPVQDLRRWVGVELVGLTATGTTVSLHRRGSRELLFAPVVDHAQRRHILVQEG